MLDQCELWRPFFWHCLNIIIWALSSKTDSEATCTTEIWHTHTDHFRLLLITIVSYLLNRPFQVASIHVASRRSLHPLLHRIEVIRRRASDSEVNQWTPISSTIRDNPAINILLLLHLMMWRAFPAEQTYELSILRSRDWRHVQALEKKLVFGFFICLMTLALVFSINIWAQLLVLLW